MLHNFGFAALLYVVNPLIALGALSHYFLDVFTSATDRGIEFLFPFTRIVGSWFYCIEGEKKNGEKVFKYTTDKKWLDETKKLHWWIEDPWRLLYKTSEPDLWEPRPQPWRRSYGPFKNSKIVDWGIFWGSVIFLILLAVTSYTTFYFIRLDIHLLGFVLVLVAIGLYFWFGERSRKQSQQQLSKTNLLGQTTPLLLAVILFMAGGVYAGILSVHIPSSLALAVLGAGACSIVVGLLLTYAYKKIRKSEDLSL